MAWMITAGIDASNGRSGSGSTAGLSIASHGQAGAGGWRFVTHNHSPRRHPALATPGARLALQEVLAQLTA
jgi:hypothetical protein